MARSADRTSSEIFGRLVRYAADQGIAIPAGKRRIFVEKDDFEDLVGSKRVGHFRIGRHQAAALLETARGQVLAVSGFNTENMRPSTTMREIETWPGIAVAAIADLEVEPIATAAVVLNVVAAASMTDAEYSGHDLEDILSLFPPLRFIEVDAEVGGLDNFAAAFLMICAADSAEGNGWINKRLADELVALAEQRIQGFPYEFLVRATLDLDPKNLYLALYRCLEATYAFKRASDLVMKLGITNKTWFEVAQALGESLSWYPRHDQSLGAVLSLPAVEQADIAALAAALGKDQGGDDVVARVATGVREIRNGLVHYGPTTRPVSVPNDDWNGVCIPLAKIVGDVFAHTYSGVTMSHAVTRTAVPDANDVN